MQQTERKPLFDLGQLVATPGALTALEKSGQSPMDFISRHVTGDWGELAEDDRKENQLSVEKGFRILSSYKTNAGETTLTGLLAQFIPEDERSVLIEDTAELQLPQTNLVRFEARRYEEVWNNRISDRVGQIQLRKFRTVNASRMLKAIADENDLSKTTLQHIKGVLSGIFTHARNEGAFDDANPVQGANIPTNAREPDETYAYNLAQICRILEFLPVLPKAIIATAAFAGLRRGELRGFEWTDYSGDALNVKRSVWKTVVNQPKTQASAKPVPVIRQSARRRFRKPLLERRRQSFDFLVSR